MLSWDAGVTSREEASSGKLEDSEAVLCWLGHQPSEFEGSQEEAARFRPR